MVLYADYTPDDFLNDDAFIRWVRTPDEDSDRFWQYIAAEHPHLVPAMSQARERIGELAAFLPGVGKTDVEDVWTRLQEQTQEARPVRRLPTAWWAAACLLLVAGSLTTWLVSRTPAMRVASEPAGISLVEVRNDGSAERIVSLGDGSTIRLAPQSTVRIDTAFRERRNVYLSGEAFFEVARDPKRPFLVHTNGLITKVLGTSFRVTAYDKDARVTVQVRTGKVAVYPSRTTENAGLLLTPNQQAYFLRKESQLGRGLVDNPKLLPEAVKDRFAFEDTPMPDIFRALEKAYGIRIVFDEEVFGKCRMTTTLDEGMLFEKLNVICTVSGASYQSVDGEIVITGRGCD